MAGVEKNYVGEAHLDSLNETLTRKSYNPDPEIEKRLLRKIDLRLLPILGLLYTICYVDRSNISVARISGLDEDLQLTVSNRASIVLLVFFIGYIIVEIPSNQVLKRIGPANWLAIIIFSWGVVTIGIGLLRSWGQLVVLRFLLGAFEGGFFPGCIYLIQSWYTRYEVQKRLGVFYCLAQGLSGFGSIFAYGLIQIAKYTTYKGWRWIYIVEGALTCLAAVASWFIIVDFPDSRRNKFLTTEEKSMVKERLEHDVGAEAAPKIDRSIIWATMRDWHVWSYAFMYMTGAIAAYSYIFFLPIILEDSLGLSQELTFILNAPPAVFGALQAYMVSWAADKWRLRAPFVILEGIICIAGLVMIGFLNSPWPRYVGSFLGQAGANGIVVTSLAWQANNVRGEAKKAVASAMLVMASAIGGIYSSLVFRQEDAPRYLNGVIAVMVVCIVVIVLTAVTAIVLRIQNRKADRGDMILQGSKDFRYTI